MDHCKELKALREERYKTTQEAERAIPQWLKDAATKQPQGHTEKLLNETRYKCKPALLYQAGWIVYEYVIRTRSEEVRENRWEDYVEVWVGTDHVFSYRYREGVEDAISKGQLALAPQAQEEMTQLTNQ